MWVPSGMTNPLCIVREGPNMKLKLATLTAVAVVLAAPAFAADLGRPITKAPAYVAAPIVNWNGFYVGGQVGYQFGRNRVTELPSGFGGDYDVDGVVGGGHLGYNFQFGNFVLGIEGDIEGSGVEGNGLVAPGVNSAFESRWQASLRGRLGMTYGNALLYVTGGAAWADIKTIYNNPGFPPQVGDTFKDTQTGWTVGAGAEWMFAPAWSARVEYRYTDFGRFTDVLPTSGFGNYRNDVDFHTVRVGVSYHFGGGPVVANY